MTAISNPQAMRTRTLLIGSLALNCLLFALWWAGRRQEPPQYRDHTVTNWLESGEVRTNIVVRRQFFSWAELESSDYTQYIENLRSINCPEQTIRDLIVADVDQLFRERRDTEVLPTTRQWWQSKPDEALLQIARRQLGELELERRELLGHLLGPDWEASGQSATTLAIRVPLDGPVLGGLSEEIQSAVQAVSGQAQWQFEQILKNDGWPPHPASLAELERQLTTELTPLLTAAQMEEFLYRYSPSAQRLRSGLQAIPLFNVTSMEMHNVFLNAQSIELRLMNLTGEGEAVNSQREVLTRERQIAFQNALGPMRYKEYLQLQDPAYRNAILAAQAVGVTNAADLFYAIEQVGTAEAAQITDNSNLTPLQQELALRQLELEQLQVAAEAMGEESPPETPPSPQRTYTFQEGDSIATVSRQTGVPVALLLRANPGLRLEGIPIGTQIVIPDRTAPLE